MSQKTRLRRLRLRGAIASKLGASSFPGSDSNGLVIREVQTYETDRRAGSLVPLPAGNALFATVETYQL